MDAKTIPKCPSCNVDLEKIKVFASPNSSTSAGQLDVCYISARFDFHGKLHGYRCKSCGQVLIYS